MHYKRPSFKDMELEAASLFAVSGSQLDPVDTGDSQDEGWNVKW